MIILAAKKANVKKTSVKKKTTGKKTAVRAAAKKKNANSGKKTVKAEGEALEKKKLSPMAFEAYCIVAVGLAILIICSLFFASDTIFGEVMLAFLRGLFGVGAYLFPFAVILAVIYFIMNSDKVNIKFQAVLAFTLFVLLISLIYVIMEDSENSIMGGDLLSGFTDSDDYIEGGLIGGLIGGILLIVFRKTGSIIIIITLMAAVAVLLSDKSVFGFIKNVFNNFKEVIKNGMYRNEEYEEDIDDIEDDEYDAYYENDEEEPYEAGEEPVKAKQKRPERKADRAAKEEDAENGYSYEKLRTKKSYRNAEFVDIKENNGNSNKKPMPDLMAKRVKNGEVKKRGKEHKEEIPKDLYVKEREESARFDVPNFLKKDNGNTVPRSRDRSEYIPSFLNKEQTYEYEEDFFPQETEDNEIVINNKNNDENSLITIEEQEEVSKRDIITVEPVEEPHNNFDVREKETKEDLDIPPWEEPAAVEKADLDISSEVKPTERDVSHTTDNISQVSDEFRERLNVVEADDEVVKRVKQKPKADYRFPKLSFLKKNPELIKTGNKEELIQNSHILEETLRSFKVNAAVVEVSQGPTVTRYELVPAVGTKVSRISSLDKDLAMRLAAENIIIEAPIPGKSAVGIEIPNKEPSVVYFSEVVASKKFQISKSKLSFALGKDVAGNVIVKDIAKAPHFLIAGATNSGKSVCINTLINCILFKASPDEVRLIMVDPKMVELNVYNGIPHLLIPVITDPHKASAALNWACTEMMRRYKLCADVGVRNLDEYNEYLEKNGEKKIYKIVIIIDELADLMLVAKKEVEGHIQRLTQLARAAGIHLIVATQRPSSDVITGVIKSNIPSRIAFSVAQAINSRIILDESGAEKLIGRGDMLIKTVEMDRTLRVQGAFISNDEIKRIVDYIKTDEPEYDPDIMRSIENSDDDEYSGIGANSKSKGGDELIEDVIAYVVRTKKASTSLIQRQFQIGYNRAARMIDELEERGIIGPENGSKPRVVLMDKEQWQDYSSRRRDFI